MIQLIVEPEHEEPEAAQVWVEGFVNGRSYRLLLDTGAARSSVVSDAHTSRLESTQGRETSSTFARRREELVVVPSLTVGPLVKRDVTLTRAPPDSDERANLIGMDVLKDHRCLFDFTQNRLLVDPPEAEVDHFRELWLGRRHHPYVNVEIAGSAVKAVWDTGASLTVVDADLVRRCPDHFRAAGLSTGADAAGVSRTTPMFVMEACQIGRVWFPAHKVAQVDLGNVNAGQGIPFQIILGYNVLRQADWLMDFPTRRWGFFRLPGARRSSRT